MFREVLNQLFLRIDGLWGALIMGVDGLAVEQVSSAAELDLESIATEFSTVLVSLLRSSRELKLGAIEELTLHVEKLVLVARWISEEYFIIVALSADGNFGRARFELRKAAAQLRDQF
ncbi:MAG TPA: roadblock/LC7 domain-containing protein [Acidobacteriota bacterium]